MCGIAGVIARGGREIDGEACLDAMEGVIRHRGPNESGRHVGHEAAFLNVRLSIVDIAGGSHPMYSADGRVGIVYNGEVYNYLELRDELQKKGRTFRSHTDTEVVLRMYEEYGTEGFKRLNGMFGFCIWDERSGDVFLVRDQFGIKPLYVYQDAAKIVFCSEIKGILSLEDVELDLDGLGFQDYLVFRYMQAPRTLFRRIERLEAGTYMRIRGGHCTRMRYWDVSYEDPEPARPLDELREELMARFQQAVRSQLMGEVPIGVLLSGGVDSSVISYFVHTLGANLTTFNIGFPEVNEFEFSRAVAEAHKLKHVEVVMTVPELIELFDDIMYAIDEPIADPACFPLYRLCRELKKEVTVVLSGEGGDELFAGYPQYAQLLADPGPPDRLFSRFLERSWYFDDGPDFLIDKRLPPQHLRFRKYFDRQPLLNAMLAYDMRTWMPDNLMMKADKILMAHSLEGRFPFLDRGLFEFAARIPQRFKIHPDGMQKWLLKTSIAPFLPDKIIERPKMGFTVPVPHILNAVRATVEDVTRLGAQAPIGGVLDMTRVARLNADFYGGNGALALQTWTVFVLCYWFQAVLPRYRRNAEEAAARTRAVRVARAAG